MKTDMILGGIRFPYGDNTAKPYGWYLSELRSWTFQEMEKTLNDNQF